MIAPFLDQMTRVQDKHAREIRRLRKDHHRIATGGRVRAGQIVGTVPPGSSQPTGAETLWINGSGSSVAVGDVVVESGDRTFTTTTTVGNERVLGVVTQEAGIINAASGRLRHSGYFATVAVQGAVAAHSHLRTSATAGKAEDAGTIPLPGCFARALTAFAGPGAGVVAAYIYPAVYAEQTNINIVIDGAAAVITTGVKLDLEVPFDCVVEGWVLVADLSGDIVIDVWRDTFANFPPVVGDSIAGTEKPTLATQQTNSDLALSTWTTTLSKGEWLRINVDSAATVTRVTLSLRVRRR